MGRISASDRTLLNKLVSDCITFKLTNSQSLTYIQKMFGRPISERTFTSYKAELSNEESNQIWLNDFTRIGFVKLHREQVNNIQTIQEYSIKRFHEELEKETPSDFLLLKLSADIRANSILLTEYGLGTPVISAIKAKLQKIESEKKENVSAIQTGV